MNRLASKGADYAYKAHVERERNAMGHVALMSCGPCCLSLGHLHLNSMRRFAENVPPKRGQQFFTAHASSFFDQRAVF